MINQEDVDNLKEINRRKVNLNWLVNCQDCIQNGSTSKNNIRKLLKRTEM
jgi:hypothetical protein